MCCFDATLCKIVLDILFHRAIMYTYIEITEEFMSHIAHPAAYEAATRRNIINNASKTFYRTYPDAGDIVEFIGANSGKSSFYSSLLGALSDYGKLTEKQVLAVRKSISTQAERKAQWAAQAAEKNATRAFVGTEKKKVTVTLTVKKEIVVDRPRFHYYDSGTSLLRICEDADGNVIVFSGNADFPAEGETATITATVKMHRYYNQGGIEVPQTIIIRPKIVASVQQPVAETA